MRLVFIGLYYSFFSKQRQTFTEFTEIPKLRESDELQRHELWLT